MATAIKIEEEPATPARAKARRGRPLTHNPLTLIAERLKFLSDNWSELVIAGHTKADGTHGVDYNDAEDMLFAEQKVLLLQAALFPALSAGDAITLLATIDYASHAVLSAIDGMIESCDSREHQPSADQWHDCKEQMQAVHTAVYRLTEWIERAHSLKREDICGDCIPHDLDPFDYASQKGGK